MSASVKLVLIAAVCGFAACAELDSASVEQSGSVDPVDDSMRAPVAPHRGVTTNLVGTGPIAYGVLLADGTKWSGTSNWTSTYNGALQRYEITISGESYYYLNYATVVTPAGDVRYCRTSSVSGNLLIMCSDAGGNPATSRIGFVTSKP
jgi:hypothetical protein